MLQDKAELPVEDLQKAIKFHLHRQQKCLEISMAEVFDLVTKVFPLVKRKRNKRRNVYPSLWGVMQLATSLLLYTGGFVASLICFLFCFVVVALKRKSTSLCFAGNSGRLTWVRHDSCKSSVYTYSFWCVQYFRVSKQWHGCQGWGFLRCAQMLMHVIAHGEICGHGDSLH